VPAPKALIYDGSVLYFLQSHNISVKIAAMKIHTHIIFVICLLIYNFAHSATYTYQLGENVIGENYTYTIKEGEYFLQLAQDLQVGFQELVDANQGVDPWIPKAGEIITIPAQYILPTIQKGIVVNLAELRLYYFHVPKPDDGSLRSVSTYAVSVGKSEQWNTPEVATYISAKHIKPNWYPPESIRKEHEENNDPLPRVVPPGPDNPLGDYSLRLGLAGYLIHGTNVPEGIGMRVTHGCIRLHPKGIERLFTDVSVKTAVNIVNHPYKAAWKDDQLLLEAHSEIEEQALASSSNLTEFVRTIIAQTQDLSQYNYQISWNKGYEAARIKTGVPIVISSRQLKLSDIVN